MVGIAMCKGAGICAWLTDEILRKKTIAKEVFTEISAFIDFVFLVAIETRQESF